MNSEKRSANSAAKTNEPESKICKIHNADKVKIKNEKKQANGEKSASETSAYKENGPINKKFKFDNTDKVKIENENKNGKANGAESASESLSDFMLDNTDDAFMFQLLKQAEKQLAVNECMTQVTPQGSSKSKSKIDDVLEDVSDVLDLSEWQRCVVLEILPDEIAFGIVLFVSNEHQGSVKTARAICHLTGPWAHANLAVGDILSLKAVWDEQKTAYVIDKDHGYCVINPDFLVSGTSVVGMLFCRRKGILHERFRGIAVNSEVMVTGSLVHELFEIVLRKGLKTNDEIKSAALEMFEKQDILEKLYASNLPFAKAFETISTFVPSIVNFIQAYLHGDLLKDLPFDLFNGKIEEIMDIEENLWVPQLGLKGKIDVSVRASRRRSNMQASNSVPVDTSPNLMLPLEMKTGRSTFSLEHKGQLILYQMMLSAIGQKTDSGLLLYLRDNKLKEIHSSHNEQRDLIIMRNEMVHYLLNNPLESQPVKTLHVTNAETDQFPPTFELPNPISNRLACSNCVYATVCCTFAKTNPSLKLSNLHPFPKVIMEKLKELKTTDFDYFTHWCRMVALEEKETQNHNQISSLWTETPAKRQEMGHAVWGLLLGNDPTAVYPQESKFIHTFTLSPNTISDLTLSSFNVGDYVIISTPTRISIAAGTIHVLTAQLLSISLERDLRQKYSKAEYFIMDKYESQSNINFNYGNLGLLLGDTERAAELRNIVIRTRCPEYSEKVPRIIESGSKQLMEKLNLMQRMSVMRALTTDSYTLIKGLPGTGKTQTLVALLRLIYLTHKTVIVTSHTHSAVDNLLLRLVQHNVPVLRLGSTQRMNNSLHVWSEEKLIKQNMKNDSLENLYNKYQIVGVTCLGSTHPIFLHRTFDYCIVDEATQIFQPTLLRPLFQSKKFVLVGDPDQLPPLVRSPEARRCGADISLFEQLDQEGATSTLGLQYRMNRTITKLANDLTYKGELVCSDLSVEEATLNLTLAEQEGSHQKEWLTRVINKDIDKAVVVFDTLDCSERSNKFANSRHDAAFKSKRISKYTNYCEAAVVLHIVTSLLEAKCNPTRIGIIAPYRGQVDLIRKLASTSVEVNTVDQYQGRDKDVIIYSCTKTGAASYDMERSREAEILEDQRRLTVAITRSKHKLIIVGDVSCLQSYTPFSELFKHIPNQCFVSLKDNKSDFSWQLLFDELNNMLSVH